MEKLQEQNPNNISDIFALSPLQEGMLFHYLKEPGKHYFEQLSLEIRGEVDKEIFAKAWDLVIETNEMLRCAFRWEKLAAPIQIILNEHSCHPVYLDLTNNILTSAEIKAKDMAGGFDLTHPPFRILLCKTAEKKYELIISNHHILYDGWSNGIILKEFFNAYHALSTGEKSFKLPIKTPFKEFIKWLQSQNKNSQAKFWKDYLAGLEAPSEFPVKRKPAGINCPGNYMFTLDNTLKDGLDLLAKNNRVTQAAIFYTAWGILLQKYSSTGDVVFGTTVSGRSAAIKAIENMVGLFINTIPLRVQTTPQIKLIDIITGTENMLQTREEFENTPLPDIAGYSFLNGSGSLFDTIVVIENYPLDNRLLPAGSSLAIHSYAISEVTHYDLSVGIMLFNAIEIKFTYNQGLFDQFIIKNMAGHFKIIIKHLIENPEMAFSDLEILSPDEKTRLLYEFNNTTVEYPAHKTIPQLFTEQVEQTPDYIALHGCMIAWMDGEVGAGAVETLRATSLQISYFELNEQSNHLAGALIEKGVLSDHIVGIMMERSLEMIIGILGILKSGAAYLPIDPEYPQERIDYMLKDSKAKILIINKSEIRNPKFETNPNDQNANVQKENKKCHEAFVLNFEN
ncbi:MAG: condensation domain-containing protein, partial [Acidobacteria bacterium]|nr:condensation domain-containing protein [Acidobacteriota bacterium]